jgi:hypothetical protein
MDLKAFLLILLIVLPPLAAWVGFYYWAIKDNKKKGVPVGRSILRFFSPKNLSCSIILLTIITLGWIKLVEFLINLFKGG